MRKYYSLVTLLSAITFCDSLLIHADSQPSPANSTNILLKPQVVDQNYPGAAVFTPPAGWRLADSANLGKSIKVMVVGKGKRELPPSINLTTERYAGTLKQYLKLIKDINAAQGNEWKDLGTIQTKSGNASLSQSNSKTNWGDMRMMHLVLFKNKTIYIMTAAALTEEFATFYQDFFNSMSSLTINPDAYEMIKDPQTRKQLTQSVSALETQWNQFLQVHQEQVKHGASFDSLFSEKEFQDNTWKPFLAQLEEKYGPMGASWQESLIASIEEDLILLKNKRN